MQEGAVAIRNVQNCLLQRTFCCEFNCSLDWLELFPKPYGIVTDMVTVLPRAKP